MRIQPEKFEQEKVECEGNEYALCIIKIADKVMDYLEEIGDGKFSSDDLITRADRELKEGITGNMAAYVAALVTKYHSRGEDFRTGWNTYWKQPNSKGVVNPAVVTFKG